jgi:sec-independent protein translocase protein TatA
MGLAFFNMDSMELVIIVVIALLLFGERLPEVAKSVGRGVMEFRKSLQDLRSQSGIDDAIRKFKDEIQVPDGVRNPRRFLEDSVRRTIAEETTPAPEAGDAAPPGGEDASQEEEEAAAAADPAAEPPHVVLDPPPALSPFEQALRDRSDERSAPPAP